MSGHAKRLYIKYINDYCSLLRIPFRKVASLMMPGFTDYDFVSMFRQCYPHHWQEIVIKYQTYQKADERLVKRGKKRRYRFPKPNIFILFKASQVINNTRKLHEQNEKPIDPATRQSQIVQLRVESLKQIQKLHEREQQKLTLVQQVKPAYSGYLLGKYLRHRRTHPEDVDTCYRYLLEASKYKCNDTIDLFQKVNATERNYHLRFFAFQTLQRFGIKEVRLRKKPKGKMKPGDKELPNALNTPDELLSAIYGSQLEHHKTFDVFLSHSSKDVDLLLKIKTMLNVDGMNVYIDWVNDRSELRRELTNQDTAGVIIERIKASKAMMYVLTESSTTSQWTPWELGYAHALNKKICVLALDEVVNRPAYLDIYSKAELQKDKIVVCQEDKAIAIKEWAKD